MKFRDLYAARHRAAKVVVGAKVTLAVCEEYPNDLNTEWKVVDTIERTVTVLGCTTTVEAFVIERRGRRMYATLYGSGSTYPTQFVRWVAPRSNTTKTQTPKDEPSDKLNMQEEMRSLQNAFNTPHWAQPKPPKNGRKKTS